MRPAALLTGLTGVVAVLVLVYVGLTAMNLEPHITFGDPNRVVASAETSDLAKPPVAAATPAAPASTAPVVAAAPAPVEKAAPQTQIPASAIAASQSSSPPAPETVAPAVVSSTPPVAPAPAAVAAANPPKEVAEVPTATAAPQVASPTPAAPVVPTAPPAATTEATRPAAVASPPSPSPIPAVTPQVAAPALAEAEPAVAPEAKPLPVSPTPPAATAVKPEEETAKSEITDRMLLPAPSLPSLQTIPTPQARPEPPVVEEAKAAPAPEKPAEPVTPAKPSPPAEEASLPPAEAEAAKRPEAPGDAGLPTPEANADLKPVDLSRPLAERAGVLTIGNKVVELAGIAPTDPALSCTGPNGKEWPCGTLARTALRAFLLGRTITCDVPDPQWKGPVTAECRFAKVSLSDWLARNGWAEPVAGSPLMAVADEARKDGRGIYGNDPRKEHKSTLAPTPPPEDPLNPI